MLHAEPREDAARVRVLVVDDDQTALQTMEGVLSDFEVVKCSSPLRALEIARAAEQARRPFDVVCSDYQMPAMNGVELLRAISLLEQQPSCILITGYVEVLRGSYAKASHIVGIIIKPFDPEQLIGLVGRLGRVTQLRRSIDQMAGRVSARKS
jgi:two-component system, sensor histidine kinase and response regulator